MIIFNDSISKFFIIAAFEAFAEAYLFFSISVPKKKNAEGIKFLGAALYADNRPLIEVGLQPYQFHNFIMTFVRHSRCNCQRLESVYLSKYRELLDYFNKKIAEALPR